MTLPMVFHPDYAGVPLRPQHQMPMSKYGYLADMLIARGLMKNVLAPGEAGLDMIARVHDISYVERVFNSKLSAEESRRIGLPNIPQVARRSRLSVMGSLLAARLALQQKRNT